jgi:hypothetical protein
MYQMTNDYGDLGFWYMERSRMLLGLGLPLIFSPIMTASYDGIAQSKTPGPGPRSMRRATPVGVSIVSNVLTRREQFHQSRLVESVLPSNVQYQDTLHRVTAFAVTSRMRCRSRPRQIGAVSPRTSRSSSTRTLRPRSRRARKDEELMMLDTTSVSSAITRLIAAATTEEALLAAVAQLFPNLTSAELSAALQVARAAAERKALRPH